MEPVRDERASRRAAVRRPRADRVRPLAGARPRVLSTLLAALVASGTQVCMAEPAAAPIVLSCTGTGATDKVIIEALCNALADEIRARVPARPLRRPAPDGPHPAGTWRGVLEVMRTEPAAWEGRLVWEVVGDEGTGRTAGPVVVVSSVDAPLSAGAYRFFARGILRASRPRF